MWMAPSATSSSPTPRELSTRDPKLGELIARCGELPRIFACQEARRAKHEPNRAFRSPRARSSSSSSTAPPRRPSSEGSFDASGRRTTSLPSRRTRS